MRPLFILALFAAGLDAQQPRPQTLRPATALLETEFGRIHSVRELADGRVLISDNSSDSRIVVADLATGQVKSIGRVGNGPGEYLLPARQLIPLLGDSTLFVSGSRPPRWSLLVGDRIVATVPPDSRAFLAASDAFGADDRGNVLSKRVAGAHRVGSFSREELAVVRANRVTNKIDTVERLRGSDMENREVGTPQRPFMISSQALFSATDQALMFPDGWIAIVRLEPYRVEWLARDGVRLGGMDLGWKKVAIGDREKAAYVARVSQRAGAPVTANGPWAEAVPPIRNSPPIAMPDGRVMIARSLWSGMEEARYDIVDRRGNLAGQVTMAPTERIAAFGKNAVYVVVTDDDGIERLRKHPWP